MIVLPVQYIGGDLGQRKHANVPHTTEADIQLRSMEPEGIAFTVKFVARRLAGLLTRI